VPALASRQVLHSIDVNDSAQLPRRARLTWLPQPRSGARAHDATRTSTGAEGLEGSQAKETAMTYDQAAAIVAEGLARGTRRHQVSNSKG
jgi:hypothetical protein